MRLLLSISVVVFLFISRTEAAGSSSDQRGHWNVTQRGKTCIIMYAQIDLTLSYYSGDSEEQKDVSLTVPADSKATGSCSSSVMHDGKEIPAQTLTLAFYEMPGWYGNFVFTRVEALNLGDRQWMLYQVNINANYSDKHFKNPSKPMHNYTQNLDPDKLPDLGDTVYASISYSLNCPSKQKFAINDDPSNGPSAYIQFSLLKVQAFKSSDGPDFDQTETCPADQHSTDKVPIIVGGVLAGLTVFTLLVYLIYRSRLPPEVLNMVNPHSHFENKAMGEEEQDE